MSHLVIVWHVFAWAFCIISAITTLLFVLILSRDALVFWRGRLRNRMYREIRAEFTREAIREAEAAMAEAEAQLAGRPAIDEPIPYELGEVIAIHGNDPIADELTQRRAFDRIVRNYE